MRYNLSYFVIFIVIIISGCEKNQPKDNDSKRPLRIVSLGDRIPTKGLVDNSNIEFQGIGFQLTNIGGTALYDNDASNINHKLEFDSDNSVWKFYNGSTPNDVYLSSSDAKIFAYYPYSSEEGVFSGVGINSKLTLDIPAEQNMEDQTDYLYASQDKTVSGGEFNINNSNSQIELKMNHAMAQIAFVVYKDGYTVLPGNISNARLVYKEGGVETGKFKINSLSSPLSLKLVDGEISGGAYSSNLRINEINKSVSLTSAPSVDPVDFELLRNNTTFYFLLAPIATINLANLSLIVNIDGIDMTVSFSGESAFQEGNTYYYILKLSGQSFDGTLEWENISITDDMGGGSGIEGDWEEKEPYSDEYGYEPWYGLSPVEIGGITWAPVNAGYVPSDRPYGLLFQWHRKYGQEYVNNGTLAGPTALSNGSDYSKKDVFYTVSATPWNWCSTLEASWNMSADYNPCPSGWRVPTDGELSVLKVLIENFNCTWVDNFLFEGDLMSGYWVGGDHSNTHSGSLFMPASGYRTETGASSDRDTYGHYFSSVTASYNALNLEFDLFNSVSLSSISPVYGSSVRCVKSN